MKGPVVAHSVKLDTDAIHPDALRAAFDLCVGGMELEVDRRKAPVDWATLFVVLEPVDPATEENVTRMRVAARRIL